MRVGEESVVPRALEVADTQLGCRLRRAGLRGRCEKREVCRTRGVSIESVLKDREDKGRGEKQRLRESICPSVRHNMVMI